MSKPIDPYFASRIYDLLVSAFDAPESAREQFVQYVSRPVNGGHEFRFGGKLGFGGKFYNDGRGAYHRWRVACYPEDETPELREAMGRVNKNLADNRAIHEANWP